MKSLSLCLCLALLATAAGARDRMLFDAGWKFHLQDASLGQPPEDKGDGPVAAWRWKIASKGSSDKAAVTSPTFDDSKWEKIDADRAKNVIGANDTSAWFRATLPNSTAPHPVLHVDSIDDIGTVYLNGNEVGHSTDWTIPVDVPLESAWRKDGPNVLVILVKNIGGSGGVAGASLQSNSPSASVVGSGPAAPDFDDHSWRDIHLPHDYVVEGQFDPNADRNEGYRPKAPAWYRKTFTLPASAKDHVIWLEFDGIYRDSIMWLNGHRLGRHASGYTSFYYDATRAANIGGSNVLTVWVDPTHNEGWWYEGGGIYRHAYLTILPLVHVAHWGTQVIATPSSDLQSATVFTKVNVENNSGPGISPRFEMANLIVDPEGRTVGSQGVWDWQIDGAPAGGTATVTHSRDIPHPELWSPDSPKLYTLRTIIRREKQPDEEYDTPFGIRSTAWDKDRGFILNGKPFKIQGTCNHQDFAGIGIALPDRVHQYKVELLKAMGCNALRFSHHQMAPELLDACDRLGMLVMDENRHLGDTPQNLEEVATLVRRDRNHPSVIVWSMCNEEGKQSTLEGGRIFKAMRDEVLKWDISRPVSSAMNEGWGTGFTWVEDIEGFNYHPQVYDTFHRICPDIPCYGSETASETITRGVYQYDPAHQHLSSFSDTAENSWKPVAERDLMGGAFVWTGFDYRGEPTPFNWPAISSQFGIMDTCGFPKDSYYYYKAEWGKAPVIHIMPHWTWPGREGQEIPVRIYSNAARVDLLLNNAPVASGTIPPHRCWETKVRYAPGTMEARGYDTNGKLIATDKVETVGPAVRLQLEPDQASLKADGEDVAIVRCNVLDAKGRVAPTAGNDIQFSLTGPARMDGVGNGDPSDLEPDKASQRHAFNGHCLAIVQSTGKPGAVTLTATSPGLQPATIQLEAKDP